MPFLSGMVAPEKPPLAKEQTERHPSNESADMREERRVHVVLQGGQFRHYSQQGLFAEPHPHRRQRGGVQRRDFPYPDIED